MFTAENCRVPTAEDFIMFEQNVDLEEETCLVDKTAMILEIRQVKSNRCLRVEFITVNQNTLCRFVCVCRTDMGERALESPDLGLCFKYPHYGC